MTKPWYLKHLQKLEVGGVFLVKLVVASIFGSFLDELAFVVEGLEVLLLPIFAR